MFFLKELPTNNMLERYKGLFPSENLTHTKEALSMLRRASLLMRDLEAYFASHGLSQLKFLILIVIHREPEKIQISLKEITERIDVSKPVITRTIASMDQDGLIEIQTADKDKRQKLIALTPSGEAKLLDLLPEYFSLIDNFMSQ